MYSGARLGFSDVEVVLGDESVAPRLTLVTSGSQ